MRAHVATAPRVALVTGFAPYGGRETNPTIEVVKALSGARIGDFVIAGAVLPVAHDGLRSRVCELIEEHAPGAVLSLGLYPGTPLIRLERFAVNLADFRIPDNQGRTLTDCSLVPGGDTALMARMPLREIEKSLLANHIPCAITNSAGTYLCNATFYEFLTRLGQAVPCGFLHVPFAPAHIADALSGTGAQDGEMLRAEQLASMDIALTTRAARLTLETISMQHHGESNH